MFSFFTIAFNDDTKEEKIAFYTLEKNKDYTFISKPSFTKAQPLGTFLFEFINCNFKTNNFYDFIIKYCFEATFFNLYPNRTPYSNFRMRYNIEEYNDLLNEFNYFFRKEFIEFRDVLQDFIDLKSIIEFGYSQFKESNKVEFKTNDYKNYFDINLKKYLKNIEQNFNLTKANITTYNVYSLFSLLCLSAWKIIDQNGIIYKCQNCGNYFIPQHKSNNKYCDNIFKENKTCKEIGQQNEYKRKLENEPILKKHRIFYQTLQKNSSIYEGKNIERYENFKKESLAMKKSLKNNEITLEYFEKWLNNKKNK